MYVAWNKRDGAEQAIARSLIADLLGAGYALAVDNGGDEYEQGPTVNLEKVFEALGHADHDELVVLERDGKKVTGVKGWVLLIPYSGDPSEYIADHSTTLDGFIPER